MATPPVDRNNVPPVTNIYIEEDQRDADIHPLAIMALFQNDSNPQTASLCRNAFSLYHPTVPVEPIETAAGTVFRAPNTSETSQRESDTETTSEREEIDADIDADNPFKSVFEFSNLLNEEQLKAFLYRFSGNLARVGLGQLTAKEATVATLTPLLKSLTTDQDTEEDLINGMLSGLTSRNILPPQREPNSNAGDSKGDSKDNASRVTELSQEVTTPPVSTSADYPSPEEEAEWIERFYPCLWILLGDANEYLKESCQVPKGCDLKKELAFLTLGQMVELAYIALFVSIYQTKKGKAKNSSDTTPKNPIDISAKLIQMLMQKPWQKEKDVNEKHKHVAKLTTLYLELGKC